MASCREVRKVEDLQVSVRCAKNAWPIRSIALIGKGSPAASLGVLFDFTGNGVNTAGQKVGDMVNEQGL